ncbi:MAG: hypothetical protein ACRDVC_07385 [Acidimicrobiales bacterium]
MKKRAFDLVASYVSSSPHGILEESLGRVRQALESSNPERAAGVGDHGVTAGALRRSATGLIWPVHWWSQYGAMGLCDFEGDLDFTPLVLDQTLIAFRGNFEVREGALPSGAKVARLGQLTLHAFLEGLTL